VVAGKRGDQQPCELVADRLPKAQRCRRPPVVDAVQAGAVFED
jgi:hypothetical protein